MGLLGTSARLDGLDGAEVLGRGLLGRGRVRRLAPTAVAVAVGGEERRVYDVDLDVVLEGRPVYAARCRQAFATGRIPLLAAPATVVAVRVDPADLRRVLVDLTVDAPSVAPAGSIDGAPLDPADVLQRGVAAAATVLDATVTGTDLDGTEQWHLRVRITPSDRRSMPDLDLRTAVPPEAARWLDAGAVLAVRVVPGWPGAVAVDWAATHRARVTGSASAGPGWPAEPQGGGGSGPAEDDRPGDGGLR